jgi:hypothetical protein
MTELVDKAPAAGLGGGTKTASPNATLSATFFIILTARTAASPVSASLLAKACAAR